MWLLLKFLFRYIHITAEWALIKARKNRGGGEEEYVQGLLDSRNEDRNNDVLFFYDAKTDIDPIHAIIPYNKIELKKPNPDCKNTALISKYQTARENIKVLTEAAARTAETKASKCDIKSAALFRRDHGYGQELAERWEKEPVSNKRRRVKEEGLKLKVKAFLKSCSKESECGAGEDLHQWQDRYIDDDNVTFYLLNALEAAIRRDDGDYTTPLSQVISTHYNMLPFLRTMYNTFVGSVYNFVQTGEQIDAFVSRLKIQNRFGFPQHFAAYFIDKIRTSDI